MLRSVNGSSRWGSFRWMLRACAWWAALVLVLATPLATRAASAIPLKDMKLLGFYGGAINTVTVDGHHAFVGQGTMVVIMDVTDPAQPRRVGFSDLLPGDVKSIAVGQDYAYAALGIEGLAVLELSNLARPSLVTVLDTVGSAEDVVMVGSDLFVAAGLAGLRIFDLTDPSQPVPAGNLNTPGYTQQVVIDGNFAYLADGRSGLLIVDVATPATPVEVGSFDTPEDITSVAYGNGFAYLVGKASSDLHAIDVTDPAAPREESVVNAGYSLDDLTLVGDYLYLTNDNYILNIYNSDPFLLNQVGYWEGVIVDMAVAGAYAYVASGTSGFTILDVDPPAAVDAVAQVATLTQASRIAVYNHIAYVPDGNWGVIAVLDASDPLNITKPTQIAACGNTWHQLTIAEHRLIVDSASSWMSDRRLCFFDLTNPRAPQQIGERWAADNQWYSPRVAAQGNRVFVAEVGWATEVNPADLTGTPLGVFTPTQGAIRAVAMPATGNLLLAATGERLLLIDVATPATPQLLGELVGPYDGDMSGRGDFVFAYNSTTRALDVIDIHTPASPHVIASIALPGDNAKRIVPVGNLLVIANGAAGVRVIDIATPTAPKEVAFYEPPADVSGLAVEGDRVYVAANDLGVIVLQIDESVLPQPSTLALPLLVREPH